METVGLNLVLLWMFPLSLGQDAVFKPPTARYGAAPPTAVDRGRCGDREPGSWSDGRGSPRGPCCRKPHAVVHSGQLWDGVRGHDLVPGAVRWIRSELCHAAAQQELLVLAAERCHLQLAGCAGIGLTSAHHVDWSGRQIKESKKRTINNNRLVKKLLFLLKVQLCFNFVVCNVVPLAAAFSSLCIVWSCLFKPILKCCIYWGVWWHVEKWVRQGFFSTVLLILYDCSLVNSANWCFRRL